MHSAKVLYLALKEIYPNCEIKDSESDVSFFSLILFCSRHFSSFGGAKREVVAGDHYSTVHMDHWIHEAGFFSHREYNKYSTGSTVQ